jgi:hypothetical protein
MRGVAAKPLLGTVAGFDARQASLSFIVTASAAISSRLVGS